MKKILQIGRLIIQIIFLFLFPGIFILAFNEIKEIYTMILSGDFNFISVLPNLLEILILIPFTILLGRFFCGWMCAFGTFNDIIYLMSKKVFKIKYKIPEKADSILKYIKYIILVFIIIVMWTLKSTAFDNASPWDAFAAFPNVSQAISTFTIGFILLAIITVGAMFIERFFCRYLCPLGAVFTVISKIRIFNINKPRDNCGKCRACTNTCAMGIPLYKSRRMYKLLKVCRNLP